MSTRSFEQLKRDVEARPGARQRLERYRRELARELTLADLRRAVEFTQRQLADVLEMTQPGISRVERQTDLYLSTLRSYVEALGGELELRVVFPEGTLSLSRLEDIEGEATDDDDPPQEGSPVRVSLFHKSPSPLSAWGGITHELASNAFISGICKYDVDVGQRHGMNHWAVLPASEKKLFHGSYLRVIGDEDDETPWSDLLRESC